MPKMETWGLTIRNGTGIMGAGGEEQKKRNGSEEKEKKKGGH